MIQALPEKPKNGLAGLKHLRADLLSGMVVSLVSLPLSSGIAIASGCPPIYGLISAIIAGLIFPFLGGAYMTIAGPAAGLAPALMTIMIALGGAGDATHVGAGYPFLLVVIFFVGCMQLIISALGLARYAAMIPVAVVEGMLASIGLMIIVKQFSAFFGSTASVKAHSFFEYLAALPTFATSLTPAVFATAAVTLAALFVLAAYQKRARVLQILPPQLLAVVLGVMLGQALGLSTLKDGAYLIKIPDNLFHGIHSPHFAELFARTDLWYAAFSGVILLTLIDGVESLATAMAIDRIDPYHRRSNPNRVLLAMGASNVISSLVGGLTIIPGGVKSKANIAAGGRTLWANFTNSICLILYITVCYRLVNLIPLGVLAAVLIYTGWKMCEPLVWRHMAHIGKEQLGIFAFTILVTLSTDLLVGIIAGCVAKLALNFYYCKKASRSATDSPKPTSVFDLFRSPIGTTELVGGRYCVHVVRPLVCFNSMKLTRALEAVPPSASSVDVHIEDEVLLIDHSSCDGLLHSAREASHSSIPIKIFGLERMTPLSHHESSLRLSMPPVPTAL